MSGDVRRNAVRRYGRSQATGFFLGFVCLMAFFVLAGTNRTTITTHLGEAAWLWFFGIGAFASLLIPPIAVQWHAIRDGWLYCPHCQNFLASIRAVIKLNKQSECNRCGCQIEIAPIDKQQARFDMIYIVGGLWVLAAVTWTLFKIIQRFIPLAG